MVEIIPSVLCGTVKPPLSKSYLNRYFIASYLSKGNLMIDDCEFADDVLATLDCLKSMGGTMDCRESATTLRFLLPLAAALGGGKFLMAESLKRRPIKPLLELLNLHGCKISDDVEVSGKLKSGNYSITGDISSQFISGLLFALALLEGGSTLEITSEIQSFPYIKMTLEVISKFGIKIDLRDNVFYIPGNQKYVMPNKIEIESDFSSAAFFLVADKLSNNNIIVFPLAKNSLQGDCEIIDIIKHFDFCPIKIEAQNIPDIVPIIALLCCAADGISEICGIERLKFKESDRIVSTCEMINALGGKCEYGINRLIIHGNGSLCGGRVKTFGDHRIAMAAGIASCICRNEVLIDNADCVKKSYPAFWRDFEKVGGKIIWK